MGGGLFGEATGQQEKTIFETAKTKKDQGNGTGGGRPVSANLFSSRASGYAAELSVSGDTYKIRINDETLKGLQNGYSGQMLNSRGIEAGGGLTIQAADSPIVSMLSGFVRNNQMETITEQNQEEVESEKMSEGGDMASKVE